MNNYDDFKTGLHDENSPINRSEEEDVLSLTDCLDNDFIDEAYNALSEARTKINALRDHARTNENVYLLKRLNEIYNLL